MIKLDDIHDGSPFAALFQDRASLEDLYITAPNPANLPRLLTHLPSSTLRYLRYTSEIPWFLKTYYDAADNIDLLLSLPQLAELKSLKLDLISDDGDNPDVELDDPPGDENGEFVRCLQRWAAKGIEIEGAYQWGYDPDEEVELSDEDSSDPDSYSDDGASDDFVSSGVDLSDEE